MPKLITEDGQLTLIRSFYPQTEANCWYLKLLSEIDWQHEELMIFGKLIQVPRLMCWYSEPEAVYRYSGVDHDPRPLINSLAIIREQIQQYCHHRFNSVLANLYRDGSDSMGWHADNEKELGINPTLASLNFGEQRLFRIRHNKTQENIDIELQQGDLLLMSGSLQHHWKHCVPKTRKPKQPRINLTFRLILAS